MKVAIYPGSFNPWHGGHDEVLEKTLMIFDQVIIAQGVNPEKSLLGRTKLPTHMKEEYGNRVVYYSYKTLLSKVVKGREIHAIVKGLRNGQDFEYEKAQEYWNQDLGIEIPHFYVISSRDWTHVSSSAIRTIDSFKK